MSHKLLAVIVAMVSLSAWAQSPPAGVEKASIEELMNVEVTSASRKEQRRAAIRGFKSEESNKLLVPVDGQSEYTNVFGGVFWDSLDIPVQDIEKIEIVRGPVAALWGANAVNGVINIITKPARDTQVGAVTLGGGSEENVRAGFRYGDHIGSNLAATHFGGSALNTAIRCSNR